MRNVLLFALMCIVAGSGYAVAGNEPMTRDRLRIAVQHICPVSGNPLGEHETPVKVNVGKEELFLCCKGCLKGRVDAKHWTTIHANFAKAQGMCPVMEKALPKKPKWTIVQGQIVYVCCPPCTKKIAADPDKYLKRIDGYYAASLRQTREERELQ